ncbi:hypothetical protein MTR67_039066 [Solanum verrucosum]|uniref:Uncharacterized protein n=1 Tax=Solanum verrucosum TaxID=315347 RepID=A0AAF0UHD7_SOLVR|nr:hypothetical protein MTR67_039066 [Solanum verrucosum]
MVLECRPRPGCRLGL